MEQKILVTGGKNLEGSLCVGGAKNSVLPILAATILAKGKSIIHNCPNLSDVDAAVNILKNFGCHVEREEHTITVDAHNIENCEIPVGLMRKMRSSVIFLGAMIGRCKKARMSFPGGCELGARPINLHLEALRKMGVHIEEKYGFFNCSCDKIKETTINLSIPSVGATENIILAAVKSNVVTTIINAAKEPEIEDLALLLNKMGAKIKGAGTAVIIIEGVKELHATEHTVIPDRIAASTYLCAVCAAGGTIELTDVNNDHLSTVLSLLEEAGCDIQTGKNSVLLKRTGKILPVKTVVTMPYPGFPTDAQAPLMACLCMAQGTSVFVENIFESRYKHVTELSRMGADIKIIGRTAIVSGKEMLYGAKTECTDLRGGAALVVAALGASGISEITGIHHIDRGYENFEGNLQKLGAFIKRV